MSRFHTTHHTPVLYNMVKYGYITPLHINRGVAVAHPSTCDMLGQCDHSLLADAEILFFVAIFFSFNDLRMRGATHSPVLLTLHATLKRHLTFMYVYHACCLQGFYLRVLAVISNK